MRPEARKGDQHYAAAIGRAAGIKGLSWARFDVHLTVLEESGLFEVPKIETPDFLVGDEFTLPAHDRVVSAWVDAVRGRSGEMTPCDPTGAFIVDGYHEIVVTKKIERMMSSGSEEVDHMKRGLLFDLHPHWPAGVRIVQATCSQPDGPARLRGEPLTLSLKDAVPTKPPRVMLEISPNGTVMFADVERSAGSRSADDAMLELARKATFTPAISHCAQVPDRVILDVIPA